eukprot:CAMPEP_0117649758 /NCGR_PEP_ID=MMETSP0804-20121206/1163_1 /TAXON_ID=1074897 /ORGANISM="Tetraselmis astigmatica, Strain CCMP880" /LENGTH=246 /DNA_ID=CAMNT_0005455557 /DNA_START=120 /DNA_END=862 /DNA_ORIENTATION=+
MRTAPVKSTSRGCVSIDTAAAAARAAKLSWFPAPPRVCPPAPGFASGGRCSTAASSMRRGARHRQGAVGSPSREGHETSRSPVTTLRQRWSHLPDLRDPPALKRNLQGQSAAAGAVLEAKGEAEGGGQAARCRAGALAFPRGSGVVDKPVGGGACRPLCRPECPLGKPVEEVARCVHAAGDGGDAGGCRQGGPQLLLQHSLGDVTGHTKPYQRIRLGSLVQLYEHRLANKGEVKHVRWCDLCGIAC